MQIDNHIWVKAYIRNQIENIDINVGWKDKQLDRKIFGKIV